MGTSAITGAPLPDFVQIRLPPQTPPPNTTTWGEQLQHMHLLRGHQQIIHSRRKSIRGKEGGREREKKKQEMVGMEKTRGTKDLGQKCMTTTGNSPQDSKHLPTRRGDGSHLASTKSPPCKPCLSLTSVTICWTF